MHSIPLLIWTVCLLSQGTRRCVPSKRAVSLNGRHCLTLLGFLSMPTWTARPAMQVAGFTTKKGLTLPAGQPCWSETRKRQVKKSAHQSTLPEGGQPLLLPLELRLAWGAPLCHPLCLVQPAPQPLSGLLSFLPAEVTELRYISSSATTFKATNAQASGFSR